MAQFARPDEQVSRQAWTDQAGGTTNLYLVVDETAAVDADYIKSESNPLEASNSVVVGFSAVSDPASATGHVLRVRCGKNAASGRQIDLWVSFSVGAPSNQTIHSEYFTNLPGGFNTFTITLSAAEADSIPTDEYDNLQVTFRANTVGSGAGRNAQISWIEFEVPDAGGGTNATIQTAVVGTTISIPTPASIATGSTVSVAASVATAVSVPLPSFSTGGTVVLNSPAVVVMTTIPTPTISQPREIETGPALYGQSTLRGGTTILGDAHLMRAPSVLTATTISSSRIDLAWQAVPDATGYDIMRDGNVIVTNHQGTSYSDTGLSGETTYTYRVRARQVS